MADVPRTSSAPVARSPIPPAEPVTVVAGWEVSGHRAASALTIADLTPLAKVLVRARWDGPAAAVLGVPHGRAARNGPGALATGSGDRVTGPGPLVAGSGPGEWLVLAPPGTAREVTAGLERAAADTELVTVMDLTHGLAVMRVTGERSASVLAKLCAADLSDRVTPDGSVLRSSVARLSACVIRDDRHQDTAGPARRSYLLHCDRSYGQYLFGSLLDAGREFGIEVDGFQLPGI